MCVIGAAVYGYKHRNDPVAGEATEPSTAYSERSDMRSDSLRNERDELRDEVERQRRKVRDLESSLSSCESDLRSAKWRIDELESE